MPTQRLDLIEFVALRLGLLLLQRRLRHAHRGRNRMTSRLNHIGAGLAQFFLGAAAAGWIEAIGHGAGVAIAAIVTAAGIHQTTQRVRYYRWLVGIRGRLATTR